MSASERAVIYVESGADLSSLAVAASTTTTTTKSSSGRSGNVGSIRSVGDHSKTSTTTTAVVTTGGAGCGSNYVIKIQIGEENMFNPVRIDVSTGKSGHKGIRQSKTSSTALEDDSALSSSGQSSPRSDMTPPPRINSGAIRFGSETSESDTESDVSSEFRPAPCQAAQFALREICEVSTPSPPPMPRSIMKNPIVQSANGTSPSFKLSQFPISSNNKRSTPNPPPDFMSLAGVSGSPDNRRMKTSPTKNISPECLKAKAELEAEILKRGKLLASGGGPSFQKKMTSIRNKEKTLKDISENGAFTTTAISLKPTGDKGLLKKNPEGNVVMEPNGFHINEINECNNKASVVNEGTTESLSNFAGYRDIFSRNTGANPIMSEKGTIRGVKNRVRDGIATFLQSSDSKTYTEKEQGRVVVYVTSMGVVRNTFQRCQKVKQILRNLLVKFDERDCYMNRSIQNEIRHRLPNFNQLALPQVFLEGQHLGDAELIEKLNETGELRDLLKPYKSLSVLTTCDRCGGFRMLPCPVCNGSKKSVHRNHFTTEFVALKCMHCDPSGLVRCDLCNTAEA